MRILKTYCHLLAEHPLKIIIFIITSILALFVYTLNKYPIPSFKDPLVGFEVRTTRISSRINTYKLLLAETSGSISSGSTTNPGIQPSHRTIPPHLDAITTVDSKSHHISPHLSPPGDASDTKVLDIKYSNNTKQSEASNEDGDEEDKTEANFGSEGLTHFSLGQSMFCGKLIDEYAQAVVDPLGGDFSCTNVTGAYNLFTLESLLSICDIDQRLRLESRSTKNEHKYLFQENCERYQIDNTDSRICCNSWSLPNYVACLANKTSCSELVQTDLDMMRQLFITCAPYFHDDCSGVNQTATNNPTVNLWNVGSYSNPIINCNSIPEECQRCDNWIYPVMNYLVDVDFVKTSLTQDNNTKNLITSSTTFGQLRATNIFLPIAKSSDLVQYYEAISTYDLKNGPTRVSAMNLGLKNSMFDLLIASDTKFFLLGLLINLVMISIYSGSIVVPIAILLIIWLSLCLSYVLYKAIGIPIFPYLNFLVFIISSGICPDNAMLFCRPWKSMDTSNIECDLGPRYTKSIKATVVPILATTSAFSASYTSRVVGIKYFSVFSVLSVLTNYFFIVILLPPVLILEKKYAENLKSLFGLMSMKVDFHRIKALLERSEFTMIRKIHNSLIYLLVAKFKITLISILSLITLIAAIVVFYYPQFSPSDNDEFQLLSSDHPFERYEIEYKRRFWYETSKNKEYGTLPIRIVFGVKSLDNGNILDPNDRGSLTYDPKFDMSDTKAQVWMLDFCFKLRQQKFAASSSGLSLTGCFIETFKSWMESRPCRDPIIPEHSRYPCCEVSHFPYSKNTFHRCLGEAVDLVHRTPHFGPQTEAGPRFIKGTNKLAAIIIEYNSNHSFTNSYMKMNSFWTEVNDWVSWQIKNTAPTNLKSGWFISDHLELLALQEELLLGTTSTIILEIFCAVIIIFFTTRDLSLCLVGSLTISAILTTTAAILIQMGWSLNIVESICISLAPSLSFDFALHITTSFKHSIQRSRDMTTSKVIQDVGGPIALTTVTTLVAGFTILLSDILAYQQIGKFLIINAVLSWIMSTFLQLPLLCLLGPTEHKSTFQSWLEATVERGMKTLRDIKNFFASLISRD